MGKKGHRRGLHITDIGIIRNNNARKLKHSSALHRNCIILHKQNSKKHEMKKVELCWELLKEGVEFVTEAEFKEEYGGMRADIFVLDDGRIYEIETSQYNLEERKEKYPNDTEIIPLWNDDND